MAAIRPLRPSNDPVMQSVTPLRVSKRSKRQVLEHGVLFSSGVILRKVLIDISLTVKAAPHECVIRTGQPKTQVKAESEAWFYSKVTVSSCRRVAEIQIFEKTYLIVIKDETGLKFKMNDSTLFLIGSYAQKLVASY